MGSAARRGSRLAQRIKSVFSRNRNKKALKARRKKAVNRRSNPAYRDTHGAGMPGGRFEG